MYLKRCITVGKAYGIFTNQIILKNHILEVSLNQNNEKQNACKSLGPVAITPFSYENDFE